MFVTNAARAILKIANLLTKFAFLVFAVMLVALLTGLATPASIAALQGQAAPGVLPGHEAAQLHLLELMLVIGMAVAIAVHVISVRAVAIIDTLKAGTPFIAVNARRLHEIGWALLAVQCIGLVLPWAAHEAAIVTGHPVAPAPSVFGGWLGVLLIFVLARVFAHGTALQDEVEGTV